MRKKVLFYLFFALIKYGLHAQTVDSVFLQPDFLKRGFVQIYALGDKKPKPLFSSYLPGGFINFGGSLEDGVVHILHTTIPWVRFNKKPPFTYIAYRVFGGDVESGISYVQKSLEKNYNFTITDIKDSTSVWVFKCGDCSKIPIYNPEMNGEERYGGDEDDGILLCGIPIGAIISAIEYRSKHICTFEGFPDRDDFYFDFPYSVLKDLALLQKHLAQWGIEVKEEKRLTNLKYVEFK